MYRELITDMLEKYGTQCAVYPRGTEEVLNIRGFLSPKKYKYGEFGASKGEIEGIYDVRYYELICDACVIDSGSVVVIDGVGYAVSHSEQYVLGGEALYTRCTLRTQGEWSGET